MARLLQMTHPKQKTKDGDSAVANTTLAAFNRVWKGKGWVLTDDSKKAAKEIPDADAEKKA